VIFKLAGPAVKYGGTKGQPPPRNDPKLQKVKRLQKAWKKGGVVLHKKCPYKKIDTEEGQGWGQCAKSQKKQTTAKLLLYLFDNGKKRGGGVPYQKNPSRPPIQSLSDKPILGKVRKDKDSLTTSNRVVGTGLKGIYKGDARE